MKWRSYWWGIEIVGESDKDDELLEQLRFTLPAKIDPVESYEDGDFESYRDETIKHLILRFHR